MPISRGIAAVDRLRPIEFRIAPRNEVAVKVGDVAVAISENRVIRRVRVQLHRLAKLLVVARLCARIRLRQGLHRVLHKRDAHPLAALRPDDRTMLRTIDGEGSFRHRSAGFFVGNRDG